MFGVGSCGAYIQLTALYNAKWIHVKFSFLPNILNRNAMSSIVKICSNTWPKTIKSCRKFNFTHSLWPSFFSGSAQIEKITLSKMPINFGRIADSVNIKPANKFIYWTLLYHCNQMHITFICSRSYSINIVSKLIIPF